ncbi:MAG TPA: gephyrin-like molybdotransferase receptor GlpR, partial [Pseudonocardia sp.]|nr:gephyrin-like molybdotransferase receptor GlpR [Pseudonocardia sp.]
MPSSMIFLGLVVLWLLILVPAVARHRQEVARPSTAALSARVLDRPGPPAERGPVRDRGRRAPARARDQEVDVTEHEEQQPRSAAVADQEGQPTAPDRDWQPPGPRYRRGRGGYDPEAAALAARARYAFRQRVVLALLVSVVATAVVAGFWAPWVWWLHAVADLALVGYLTYLRRQVRLEESIRQRRAARMAGTRRTSVAEDPALDEWARRGRAAASGPDSRHHDDDHRDDSDDRHDGSDEHDGSDADDPEELDTDP